MAQICLFETKILQSSKPVTKRKISSWKKYVNTWEKCRGKGWRINCVIERLADTKSMYNKKGSGRLVKATSTCNIKMVEDLIQLRKKIWLLFFLMHNCDLNWSYIIINRMVKNWFDIPKKRISSSNHKWCKKTASGTIKIFLGQNSNLENRKTGFSR